MLTGCEERKVKIHKTGGLILTRLNRFVLHGPHFQSGTEKSSIAAKYTLFKF